MTQSGVLRRILPDLSVLRDSRDLRLVIIGEAVSGVGTQAALVAVPFQVFVLTRSTVLVGLIGLVELVPLVATSLFGGALADRVDRRRVLIVAQALIVAVAGTLAATALLGTPPVWIVFPLAGALAAAAALDNVTRAAIVPALAGDRLRPALALAFGLAQVAAIAGPALGGGLIAAGGVGAAYALDAGSSLLMLGLACLLRPLRPAPAEAAHPPILRSVGEGLRFVRGNRALLGSFAIDLGAMTFGMPRALFPVLALTVYHAGAAGAGTLYAAVAAGATLAAVTTGWLEHARWLGRIVIGAVVAWGLAIAAAGLVHSLALAALLLAVAGAADSVSAVCRSTINQTVTPEALRGRMSSVYMLVVTSGPRLGDLESGLVAGATSAATSVVTGGLACLGGVVAVLAAFPQLAAYDGRPVSRSQAAQSAARSEELSRVQGT